MKRQCSYGCGFECEATEYGKYAEHLLSMHPKETKELLIALLMRFDSKTTMSFHSLNLVDGVQK